jgi:hypothetical protein
MVNYVFLARLDRLMVMKMQLLVEFAQLVLSLLLKLKVVIYVIQEHIHLVKDHLLVIHVWLGHSLQIMGQLHVLTVPLEHTQFQAHLHVFNAKQVHIQS